MPQERLPNQAVLAKVKGKRPVGRPEHVGMTTLRIPGWNLLGFQPSEIMEVLVDRDVWRINLEMLPSRHGHERVLKED